MDLEEPPENTSLDAETVIAEAELSITDSLQPDNCTIVYHHQSHSLDRLREIIPHLVNQKITHTTIDIRESLFSPIPTSKEHENDKGVQTEILMTIDALKHAGIRVLGVLHESVSETVTQMLWHFNGIVVNYNERMVLQSVYNLVECLRADNGRGYEIIFALPVEALIAPRKRDPDTGAQHATPLEDLEINLGSRIAWYYTRIENSQELMLDARPIRVLADQGWPTEKLVLGLSPYINTTNFNTKATIISAPALELFAAVLSAGKGIGLRGLAVTDLEATILTVERKELGLHESGPPNFIAVMRDILRRCPFKEPRRMELRATAGLLPIRPWHGVHHQFLDVLGDQQEQGDHAWETRMIFRPNPSDVNPVLQFSEVTAHINIRELGPSLNYLGYPGMVIEMRDRDDMISA